MCSKQNRRFKCKPGQDDYRKNESKASTKHKSCECKDKFDGQKHNSDQKWDNNKFRWEFEKHNICEKNYTWNPAICSFENGNYLANILDDSFLTCDEIILFHSEVRTWHDDNI